MTIEHAFGTTEITEEPQRIVTWGWGSHDAAIALGVIPVAMPSNSYGALESGLMPWQAEALEAAGAETPQLLTEGTEVIVFGMIVIGILWLLIDRLLLAPLERSTIERWGMVHRA